VSWPTNRTFNSRALELVVIGFLAVWLMLMLSGLGFAAWWAYQVMWA
jgi:hypothetical protein